MRRVLRTAAALLAAAAVGAGVGLASRAPALPVAARPPLVERVVRALDRFDAASPDELRAALDAAGPSSAQPSPWREELELGALVLRGDGPALRAFAAGAPAVPARARAALRLALEEPPGPARTAAFRALRTRFPSSAAATVYESSRASGAR